MSQPQTPTAHAPPVKADSCAAPLGKRYPHRFPPSLLLESGHYRHEVPPEGLLSRTRSQVPQERARGQAQSHTRREKARSWDVRVKEGGKKTPFTVVTPQARHGQPPSYRGNAAPHAALSGIYREFHTTKPWCTRSHEREGRRGDSLDGVSSLPPSH